MWINISREELQNLPDGGISSGALLENSCRKPQLSDLSYHNDAKPNEKVDFVHKVQDVCTTKVSTELSIDSFRNTKEKCKYRSVLKDQKRKEIKKD